MIKSPLKWVGSKKALYGQIVDLLPSKCNNFFDPFMGSNVLSSNFYTITDCIVYINDINEDLVNFFEKLSSPLESCILLEIIKNLSKIVSENHYYEIRDRYKYELDPMIRAAIFYYLNRCCYGGLYRVNSKGVFNIPYSKDGKKSFNIEDLSNFSMLLKRMRQRGKLNLFSKCYSDFLDSLLKEIKINPELKNNSVLFLDPPYHKTFASYNEKGFNAKDQVAIRDYAIQFKELGFSVICCNSNNEFVDLLYKDFNKKVIDSTMGIATNSNKSRQEVLMWL